MFYKMAITNSHISYSLLVKLLFNISKFYIIITPTISINHYIIYLILDTSHSINELEDIKHTIIYNYGYNKIIYKIFKLFLSNYNSLSNNYIFIDYTFYNLQNIKIHNYFKSNKYLSIIQINKQLKHFLYNFFNELKKQLFWIYHNNSQYLKFLTNYILNYNRNIISLDSSKLITKTKLQIKNKLVNYSYILININANTLITDIILFIQKYIKSLKYNILLLSNEKIFNSGYYTNIITCFTFSNLIN